MKRESRKTIRIVVPLSSLISREEWLATRPSDQVPGAPVIVGHPKPRIDWVSVIAAGCMLVITAMAIYSALRQKKAIADRGYGA